MQKELKNGRSMFSERMVTEADQLEIGESLLVDIDDFEGTMSIGSHILNNHFKKNGSPKRFRMKSLKNHKGWIFIRRE